MSEKPVAGTGGNKYVPYSERTGNESIVYFTRDLSPEGLEAIYKKICGNLTGKIAIKLHTGEKNGPNIIPRPWVKKLIEDDLPDMPVSLRPIHIMTATDTPQSSTERRSR